MNLVDLTLLKQSAPEGWVDLGIGEPHIVREVLNKILGEVSIGRLGDLQYPLTKGDTGILNILQQRHRTENVVITNGAKQALSATFYALKQIKNIDGIYLPKPYWLSFPTLIKREGLQVLDNITENSAALLTIPNNPDGHIMDNKSFCEIKVPKILDFAYNTPQYLKEYESLLYSGDIHIFSYAKKYGLSGIRVGYAVCKSSAICNKMVEFMEITTSGVSLFAQRAIEEIERFFGKNPQLEKTFYDNCRTLFDINRDILKKLDPKVLDPMNISSYGMFAFLKKGNNFDRAIKEAKVKVLDGEMFGKDGYCRLSLGVRQEDMEEAVRRLNHR